MNTNTYTRLLNAAAEHHEHECRNDALEPGERKHHQRKYNALTKALAEALAGHMPTKLPGLDVWLVGSRTQGGMVYRVSLDAENVWRCNCSAGINGGYCWHPEAQGIAQAACEADMEAAHVPVWSEKESPGTPYADMGETPPDVCAVDELDAWLTNEMNLPSRVKG